MNSVPSFPAARVRVYWYAWLAVLALALGLRFTVFLGASADRLFALASAYALGTWLPVMALNVLEGRRLSAHLKLHHPKKWERLTCVPGLGLGRHNGFRSLRWLYSPDDFGDPTVARLKKEQRRFICWALTVFFSYAVVMPVLLGL